MPSPRSLRSPLARRLSLLWLSPAGIFFASLTVLLWWTWWTAPAILLHLNGVLTRAEAVESKVNASAVNLDRATAAWSASSSEQASQVTDLATDIHGLVGSTDAVVGQFGTDAADLHRNLASIATLTDAGASTARQATADLTTLQTTIAASQPALTALPPLLTQYTTLGQALTARLADPSLARIESNLASATDSGQRELADFYVWSHPILNPPPCVTRACRIKRGLEKVNALLDVGYRAEEFSRFWSPLPVSITH
jgi:hypothetical protein